MIPINGAYESRVYISMQAAMLLFQGLLGVPNRRNVAIKDSLKMIRLDPRHCFCYREGFVCDYLRSKVAIY